MSILSPSFFLINFEYTLFLILAYTLRPFGSLPTPLSPSKISKTKEVCFERLLNDFGNWFDFILLILKEGNGYLTLKFLLLSISNFTSVRRYKGLSIELTFVPRLQIKLGKYWAGKYVWHCFRKGERSRWESKQNKWLCKSSRLKGFYKKGVLRNLATFTKKYLCRNLFFDKVRRCRSATLLMRLQHGCFLVNFVKFVRIPFCRTPRDGSFYP